MSSLTFYFTLLVLSGLARHTGAREGGERIPTGPHLLGIAGASQAGRAGHRMTPF